MLLLLFLFFFFFKQKTAYEMRISDWSSDVCSSDLTLQHMVEDRPRIGRQAVLITGKRRLHLARIAGAERDEGLLLRRGEQLGLFARVRREDVERRGGIRFGKLRSAEHTSELQSLLRISYAVF